ncbi:MAG: pantetheine-phosphate adenylyltransferase [Nanoarchaeota archaeon]
MVKAIYALSADPITYGHMNIVERTVPLFDEIRVVVANSTRKLNSYTFSLEERAEMARHVLIKYGDKVKVEGVSGLLVDYADEQCIPVMIRSVRDAKDASDEEVLALTNAALKKKIQTFFLYADPKLKHVSSSMVKEVQREQGLVHEFVPLYVKQKLEERISGYYLVGATGEIASGKSYISRLLVKAAGRRGLSGHWINFDRIGHEILEAASEPKYVAVRKEIQEKIGNKHGTNLLLPDGTIDRHILGQIVFQLNNNEDLHTLNGIMHEPMLFRMRRQELPGKKGIIIFDAALIAETYMSPICNNNIILVSTDRKSQRRRLRDKGYSQEKTERRMGNQYNYSLKHSRLREQIEKDDYGHIWTLENPDVESEEDQRALDEQVETLLDNIIADLDVKPLPESNLHTLPSS